MATPLHHDQPQQSLRLLQTLKARSKKNAENLINSECIATEFAFPQRNTQHAENPTNQQDSQLRRGAQQLPGRPPLSPHHRQQQQNHLRQRHRAEPSIDPLSEVRPLENPRLGDPVWYDAVNSPQGLDCPHVASPSREHPHVVSPFERPCAHPHVVNLLEGGMHHATVNGQLSLQHHTGESIFHHAKVMEPSSVDPHQQKQLRNQWGPHGPHADPVEAQNTAESEKHPPKQKLASSSIADPCTRDYKAALIQQMRLEQPHSQQYSGHKQPSSQNAMEDYFGCKQDERRQGQGQSSRLDQCKQAEEKQQYCQDFSKMQYFRGEESPNINSGNDSHVPQHAKLAKQHDQQSDSHLVKPSLEKYHHEDQVAEDQAAVDHETSAANPHPETGTKTPPLSDDSIGSQLHECQLELSDASSDDSYFHVSKELVERDYQNECHLAASSTNQQSCGHVYDYSRAGVTLVDNSSKLVNEQQLDKDQCGNEKGLLCPNSDNQKCKEDCSSADTQNHPGILEHQLQDVESPPLFLGFNQNSTRFACGTSKGFRVYDIDTMNECFSSTVGGVGLVEQLLCTNTFLLVGGGPNPSFPPNKVILWDGVRGEFCGERSQKYPVLAVKVRQDRLVVVVEHEVFIYNYGNPKLLFQVITTSNPRGLCTISINEGPSILACPGLRKGEVRIEHIGISRGREELPTRNSLVISAHGSSLACMALTLDGSLLATASDKGTLIRVFNTHNGTTLKEVRRGVDRAEIFSIAFSFSSDWLAVSSDKGTVHVFGLGLKTTEASDASSTPVVKNSSSTLSFIKGVLPKYFSSEWSAAQFKLPEEMKSVVAFGQEKQSILILGTDGSFYKCSFDPEHGGDMKQLEYSNFMKPREGTT